MSTHRTSSSRISAAVPGIVSRPASRGLDQEVLDRQAGAAGAVDDLHRREGVDVHLRHPALHRGDQVEVGRARELGVDAALHAHLGRAELPRLLGAVGDLVQRQRVRVGVGAPLGERAEPAADVADVGEVDVAVDDVGDLVADGLAGAGGRPAGTPRRAARRRRSSAPAPGRRSAPPGPAPRPAARRPAGGRGAATPVVGAARLTTVDRPLLAHRVPVAVDRVEVRPPVARCGPAVSTAVCRSVRPAATKPPSGSCHGRPTGRTPTFASPSSDASAATWAEIRGSSHGSPARTYSGCTVSRGRSSKPAAADSDASRSSDGHGRSGLTWSGVSGETPPQSSMPAASSARALRRRRRPGWAAPGPGRAARAPAG